MPNDNDYNHHNDAATRLDRRHVLKTAGALPVAVALGLLPQPSAFAADQRAQSRAAQLARGAQLTFLFEDYLPAQGGMANRATRAIRDADLRRLQALGVTYVRLSVSPFWVLKRYGIVPIQHEKLMADIERFIARAHAHQIAVMLTCMTDNVYKDWLLKTPSPTGQLQEDLVEFWTRMEPIVAGADASRLFLEPVNEPNLPTNDWVSVQEPILQMMRGRYPEHTLVATSSNYSNVGDLARMQPVSDTNVVYVFHFYEPFVFVNQGSPIPGVSGLHGVQYPTNPAQREAILQQVAGDAGASHLVSTYFDKPWNAQRMQSELAGIAQWAQRHGVIVHAGEIGINQARSNGEPVSDLDSRVRCYTDLRTTLESLGIGWSVYGYDDPWGLCTWQSQSQDRLIEPRILAALGLMPEQGPPTTKAGGWNPLASPQNGWWWNPNESGMGIGWEMHDMRFFCAVFMYDRSGQPIWYSSGGEASAWLPDGQRMDVLRTATASYLSESEGGTPFDGAFRPVARTNDQVSYFNLEADSGTQGSLRWIAPEQPLARFEFAGPGTIAQGPAADAPESGWWWDAQQPGWGCFIEFQGALAYMAIFTYAPNGRPEWYSGTGRIEAGRLAIPLGRYVGGRSLNGPGRAVTLDRAMGTFSMQFSNRREGTYRFPGGATGRLVRFAF